MTILSNGYVLYQGPSLIDQNPITVVVTGFATPSSNPKTGPMLQTWVFPSAGYPSVNATKPGTHSSCGDCPLRLNKVCYVNMASVNQVYKAWLKGNYPPITPRILKIVPLLEVGLRLTAYGEVTAVPFSSVQPLIEATKTTTGYTHRWETCDSAWKSHLMASVESLAQAQKAWDLGWKSYRILGDTKEISSAEILCKNAENPFITCKKCGLCNGQNQSVAIVVHGRAFKQKAFRNSL